jgi:HAMP domain-containing protein
MRLHLSSESARTRRKDTPRISRWLHSILEVPLEIKLLGANLLLVGLAVLLLFGPVHLQPSRLTDAYVVMGVLMLGAAANFGLVRLALRPLRSIERVAKSVSQGRFGERVPASMVADRDLRRLSRTINDMLDSLAADRQRIETLAAEAAYREDKEHPRPLRLWRGTTAGGIRRGTTTVFDAS